MIRVAVSNHQKLLRSNPARIGQIVRAVLRDEGVRHADISVALVDNPTIHRLNRNFLRHDWPTDVITFPLSTAEDRVLSGEIIISTETARRAARQRGHSRQAEFSLYLIHGLLHLCGLDDRDARQRKAMRQREQHYLRVLRIRLKERVHSITVSRQMRKGKDASSKRR